MDVNDLLQSCRRGDLGRVRYLVEQKDVDVNIKDKWDSTPLVIILNALNLALGIELSRVDNTGRVYYACLCGHLDIVNYLLEMGARCEANTFDGERCLYGALNTEIRNALRDYKVVTSHTLRRDDYEEYLRRLLDNGEYSDMTFSVHGEEFKVHKCVLSARSEYFLEMFMSKWKDRDNVSICHSLVRPSAFRSVMQYIYTGRLETHIDRVEDCIVLSKQCRMPGLIKQLEETVKKAHSFECTKPGTNVTTILIEPEDYQSDVAMDLGVLADQAVPSTVSRWVGGNELPFLSEHQAEFSDLCVRVQGQNFFCHKAFICGRSDYFKAIVHGHFAESSQSDGLLIVTLHDVSVDVFITVLYFIYTNNTQLSADNVDEVLCAADMYLLPGLKRQCATVISQNLDESNVVDALRTARLFDLARLEDQCAEFIARRIEKMVDEETFQQLVLDDASTVQGRQETDSIGIIDDVRFHITSNVQTFSAMAEAEEKLQIIDELLERLQLDA